MLCFFWVAFAAGGLTETLGRGLVDFLLGSDDFEGMVSVEKSDDKMAGSIEVSMFYWAWELFSKFQETGFDLFLEMLCFWS